MLKNGWYFKLWIRQTTAEGKNKRVIGLMKDKLGIKIMKKFVGLKAKFYKYLIDDDSEDIKIKTTKIVSSKKT